MRKKLISSVSLIGLMGALMSCGEAPIEYDLLIMDGTIVDGTGEIPYEGDIAVNGNEIVKIGALEGARAKRVIDATGLAVSPGFIDLHSHADNNIMNNPDIENFLHQGVTTILAGNCGRSPMHLDDYFSSIEDTKVSVNFGLLIGHNTVREEVMGNENRSPTAEEQTRMETLIKEAMDDGAFGMSTGLIYLPGTYSETGEIINLAKVVSKEGGIYASHMRNEFGQVLDAIDEAITIGREASLPVHISHFKVADNTMWGDSIKTLGLVAEARLEGLDITVDQYPYKAGSTGLQVIIPSWARAGTREEFQARLDNPESRSRIKKETIDILNGARAAGDLANISIASFEEYPQYSGKNLAEVVEMNGMKPTVENGAEIAMKILYNSSASAIYHMMIEEDIERIMKSPFTSIASDGSAVTYQEGVPHLRNYGTYPRVLGKYVREQGVLSLEEAIYKMTKLPAQSMKLKTRGTLAEGMTADINIFNPVTVSDHYDWPNPHQYATGFSYVIVNGVPVIDRNKRTSEFPGAVLRRGD